MNEHTLATLAFYAKYSSKWHSYDSRDKDTQDAVKVLTALEFLTTNKHGQARFTGKTAVA